MIKPHSLFEQYTLLCRSHYKDTPPRIRSIEVFQLYFASKAACNTVMKHCLLCLHKITALFYTKDFQDPVHKIKKVSLHYLRVSYAWLPLVKPHLKFK